MGRSIKRNFTVHAEPGLDWNELVKTVETIAASSFAETPKDGDGTIGWVFAHTYRQPFDKDDVAIVMAKHPQITKMAQGKRGHPGQGQTEMFFGE